MRCGACGASMSTRSPARGRLLRMQSLARRPHRTPGCRSVKTTVGRRARRPPAARGARAGGDRARARRCRRVADRRARARPARSSCASSAPATRRSAPSARSTPASRRTGSSPAASRPAGSRSCTSSPKQRPSSPSRTCRAPEPSREQLEALARDLPKLWAAESTRPTATASDCCRAMIADITLTSKPDGRELQVGIRWRSGAAEQHTVQRPEDPPRRHPHPVRGDRADQAPRRRPHQHADRRAAQRRRDAHRHRPPVRREARCSGCAGATRSRPDDLPRDGELTVSQIAERLGISDGTVYALDRNRPAHRPPRARQPALHPIRSRRRATLPTAIANSVHLPTETKIRAAGGAV